jgi:hypothetical protein
MNYHVATLLATTFTFGAVFSNPGMSLKGCSVERFLLGV